ncbi:chaplin [Streptomyces natalensis]|uniref:Chaplin domain-containing protein n=1 Tax=Streptomyces natalensis ATCC 27448 TaxID=1240678 RepID=A0A0D7CRZ6_9ACTN|nr:chaplin [Streptomyces natalensis]KIZ18806.1 hypothetical protein SNA_05975 [Streptomyces natalensis ATCC 27448]
MKRFVRTTTMAAVSCAMVLGSASVATAGGHHHHGRGATAVGFAKHSPGAFSGNVIQFPIDIPINVCGNSVDGFALINPAFGNICLNK